MRSLGSASGPLNASVGSSTEDILLCESVKSASPRLRLLAACSSRRVLNPSKEGPGSVLVSVALLLSVLPFLLDGFLDCGAMVRNTQLARPRYNSENAVQTPNVSS